MTKKEFNEGYKKAIEDVETIAKQCLSTKPIPYDESKFKRKLKKLKEMQNAIQ